MGCIKFDILENQLSTKKTLTSKESDFFTRSTYLFGFNGKEKDPEWTGQEGSHLDFGARVYDSRIGRWLALDPLAAKYPNLSPYAFVGNMPIIAIDPDGEDIVLVGSNAEKKASFTHLQKLTNDKLTMDPKTGKVTIVKLNSENSSRNLSKGTYLVRKLVVGKEFYKTANKWDNSEKTVKIKIGKKGSGNSVTPNNMKDAKNGKGTDATVNFDPTANPKILTKNPKTGNVSGANRPDEIGLSHELIHTDHIFKGDVDISNDTHTYQTASGTVTQTVMKEELRTVGLKHNKKNDVTENDIRNEQGQNDRGGY